MDEYRYEPLPTDSDRQQIRLLTLLSGEGADELECTVSHVSLLDQPASKLYHITRATLASKLLYGATTSV
jgi:hypothetical protein